MFVCNTCLCSDPSIGPLSLQMKVPFFICAWFCLLVFKPNSSHILSCFHNHHLKPHTLMCTHRDTHAHSSAWTHICKTNNTDWLWSFKKLLKMSASNFYYTHTHSFGHTLLLHTENFLSEEICILILMLLVVYVSDCEVWPTCSVHFVTLKGNPIPLAVVYRFSNCSKIMESLKINRVHLRYNHCTVYVLIIIPQGFEIRRGWYVPFILDFKESLHITNL